MQTVCEIPFSVISLKRSSGFRSLTLSMLNFYTPMKTTGKTVSSTIHRDRSTLKLESRNTVNNAHDNNEYHTVKTEGETQQLIIYGQRELTRPRTL